LNPFFINLLNLNPNCEKYGRGEEPLFFLHYRAKLRVSVPAEQAKKILQYFATSE
jgi:hypothetical protein